VVARRAGRALVRLTVWLLLAVAATGASVAFHLNLPRSRRLAKELLTRLASGELRGDLEIGRFVDVRLDRILVEDLVLRDADGVAVVEIDVAEITPDLSQLLSGTISFPVVEARGALLRLRRESRPADPDDLLPSFLRAFEPADPSPGGGGAPAPRVVLGALRLRDVRVVGRLLGRGGIDAEDVRLDGRLTIEDGDVELRIWNAGGLLVAPYPFEAELRNLTGTIDTRAEAGISLYAHLRSRRPGEDGLHDNVRLRVEYFLPPGVGPSPPAPRRLELRAQVDPLLSQTLEDVGIEAAAPLTGPLWGTVQLVGPENDLALRLDLDTLAGPLTVDGTVAGPEVRVEVAAAELALHRLIEGIPTELPVGGRVRVDLAPSPEQGSGEALRLTADLEPFTVDGWAVPGLRGEGRIVDGVVELDRIEGPTGGGEVAGRGRFGPDSGEVFLDLRARLPALSREPNLRRVLPGARGRGTSELALRVDDGRVLLDGRVVLDDFSLPPFRAERLVVSGRVEGEPARPRVDLTAQARGASLADFPLGEGTAYLAGGPSRYTSRGRFAGSGGRRVAFEASAERRDGDRWAIEVPTFELAAGRDQLADYAGVAEGLLVDPGRGTVELEELRLVAGTQRLSLRGRYEDRGDSNLNLTLQNTRIASVLALLPGADPEVDGRVDAEVSLAGSLPGRPAFRFEGGLRGGRIGPLDELEGAFRAALDEGELMVDLLFDLGRGGGAVGVRGSGLVDQQAADLESAFLGGVYELELELAALDLAVLASAGGADLPIEGAATTGTMTIQGSPYAPDVSAKISAPEVALVDGPTLPVATRFDYETGVLVGELEVGPEGDPLMSAEASLLVDLATLIVSPETAREALETLPWRLSLRSDPRRLDTLPSPWKEAVPAALGPLRVAGSLTLAGGSTPLRGDATLSAEWDPTDQALLPCPGLVAPRAQLLGTIREGRTTLDASGFVGTAEVLRARSSSSTPYDAWLTGRAPLALPKSELDLAVQELPVDALPGLCGRATGSLVGELRARRLFSEAPELELAAATPDFRVRGGARVRATATGTLDGRRGLDIGAQLRWPGGERAELDLALPLRWGGPEHPLPSRVPGSSLETVARFSAAPIAPLLLPIGEIAEARGYLTGEVRIHGPLESFQVDGEVVLEEGALDVVPLGQQLRDVRGTLDFRGDWVRLADLRARDGDGVVRLDGSLSFAGLAPRTADLAINAQDFPVRQQGSVLARVGTSARLVSEFLAEEAQVDLDLRQLDVALPEQSSSTVQGLDPHPDVEVVGRRGDDRPDGDGPAPYHFVFDVETLGSAWVRRSDFSAEVRARLDAEVIGGSLRLAGTVELLRGIFEVFGKRFEVQRGGLAFSGSEELDPGVSLVAVHTLPAGDDTVTVIVGGTLLAPTVDFTSTHPTCRADEEVIALLVSGACSVADTFAASGESTEAEQQALNFLAGITAGVLTLGARRQFGELVPVLVIESGDTAFQSARVRAGFRADSLVPDFLRGVIRGLYIEGQVTAEQGAAVAGAGQDASEGPSGAAFSGGFLFELRFPYDLVGRTTFESSSNAWSVDLTWEP